ncbi:methionine adenosyltransferase [Anaeromyxobacter paludicola]|uniref:S-adenosylmethionine synthase n=1 Tax=Anaeromyxobacter paludicola TaxID=2918171 RepID=A0ABM7X9T3_9BACT|nr:methionine adenosyltransferase [Anaeromyxobacter paludicola]BDG08605.1 S-adenosylmethionine synthase [Anaeromyxobacter paludicola]
MSYDLRTSESVSEGHPDKVADLISDTILDAALRDNRQARVAVEALVTRGRVVLAGEVGGLSKPLDYAALARGAIREIGYLEGDFSADEVFVETLVHEQSPEIAAAVAGSDGEEGAGDQGIMFGYACKETPELMPAPIHFAHRIVERLASLRKAGEPRLKPDAKCQVTVEYVDGVPQRAHTVVVSHQHAPDFKGAPLEALVREVVRMVLPPGWFDANTRLLVNPSGSFVQGGPAVDTGLTGRKIIVDTYGGAAPHGGGAFSGKDPSKVDRSAAYAARWLAKNVVASGLADRCLIQLAYAIGVAKPVAVRVETFGSGPEADWTIARAIERCVDLTPRAIRERLGLDFPRYAPTAAYGHFGRRPVFWGTFSWEKIDLIDPLLQNLA